MRRLVFALKFLVTLLLLGWLAWRIEVVRLIDHLAQADAALLCAGLLLLVLQLPLGALRWQLILRRMGVGLPWSDVLRWTYTGVFINQVLPATIGGDAVRILLATRAGAPTGPTVRSVVLDRVALLGALLALVVVSAPGYGALLPPAQRHGLAVLLVLLLVTGTGFMFLADALPPAWRQARWVGWVASLSRDSRRLFLGRMSGPVVVGLSVLSVVNLLLSLGLFAMAFGAQVPAWQLLTVLPPVILASTLPISLGGWGTRELAMVAAMASVAVTAEIGVLASVTLGAASALAALPGAFFHFRRKPTARATPITAASASTQIP